jgi:hypothetical protein
MVARLAAQVVAYRVESRKTDKDSAAGILYDKRVSVAVRTMVGDIRIEALRERELQQKQ